MGYRVCINPTDARSSITHAQHHISCSTPIPQLSYELLFNRNSIAIRYYVGTHLRDAATRRPRAPLHKTLRITSAYMITQALRNYPPPEFHISVLMASSERWLTRVQFVAVASISQGKNILESTNKICMVICLAVFQAVPRHAKAVESCFATGKTHIRDNPMNHPQMVITPKVYHLWQSSLDLC